MGIKFCMSKLRKAVIPAAGFGTRLFPATKGIKKEFFPVVDQDGKAKPVIQIIVEEAIKAEMEEIGIVIQDSDRNLFEDFFQKTPTQKLWHKLKPQQQEYSLYLQQLGERITFLTQNVQEGFGHAVFCAKSWVGEEPFLLLLGDHIYTSLGKESCAQQMLAVYQQINKSVLGVRITPGKEICHYGCVQGVWQNSRSILKVNRILEKPTTEYARKNLHVEGMKENEFLSVFGMYLLTPQIFTYLEDSIQKQNREGGEFQLTSCLDSLQRNEGMIAYLVQGKCFDIGLPEVYQQTVKDFGQGNK